MTRCIYCGFPTAAGRRACIAHFALIQHDPWYGLARGLAKAQYPALVLEDRAPAPKVKK